MEPMGMSDLVKHGLDIGDIESDLGRLQQHETEKKFLRTFTSDDMRGIINKVGLFEHLEKKGLDDVTVSIDVDESFVNYLKLYWKDNKPQNLLLDLRLSESKFMPDKKFFDNPDKVQPYDMIVIEWLSAQNPINRFSDDKPQLPGQVKPGLGILRYCFDMMYVVAKEIIKDGFMDIPDHFHGAVMYSKKFKFFDPAHEGVLRALIRDLKNYSLYDISWGVITGTVIEEYKKEPQPYDPSEQVFYVSQRMRDYFHSSLYRNTYNKYYRRKKFHLEYDTMVKLREDILKNKDIEDI